RHILGLFQAVPGAKAWRRTLSEEGRHPGADSRVIVAAAARVAEEAPARQALPPRNQAAAPDLSSAALA
ncbi:MAG TPA: tRNA dihydrouridine(20/20a) synthase DusA, partial [Alphaproteobacteria bacterium]|nr:tRNA dihydrouridine(20/20a) synthase DusA [Alphaproteobacteria bacterium]